MEASKKSLQVTIESSEFAKEFNYFITVQLGGDGEKRRTDVSAAVSNPIFSANTFYLPITAEEMIDDPRLHFAWFTVTDRKENAADYEK